MRIRHSFTALLTLALVSGGLVSCTASPQATAIEVTEQTIVVDVRTAEEYSAGHLDGAVNVNLQSGRFESEIAEYDPEAEYVVYCRTGSRSAQAVATMEAAGFDDVTDAGGIDSAASATGLPIVTE
jgi:phage shock protein E